MPVVCLGLFLGSLMLLRDSFADQSPLSGLLFEGVLGGALFSEFAATVGSTGCYFVLSSPAGLSAWRINSINNYSIAFGKLFE